jgi:hypothetical protein
MPAGTEAMESRSVLARILSCITHPLVTILLVIGPFCLAAWFAWQHWGPEISTQAHFQLKAEMIHVMPPRPEWIRTDIKAAAIDDGKLTALSLPDKQLLDKVRGAFLVQNWVASVSRVAKRADGVDVVLVYRRPVAMVEVIQGEPGLLPIDADAVCLPPEDFDPTQVDDFLRVMADNSGPAGPIGTYWGDERIRGGASIAAQLSTLPWKQLDLYRIRTRTSGGSRGEGPYQYDLVTRDLFLIRWGFPPGQEVDGEASASTKLAHLVTFAEEHGSLVGEDVKGQELDLTDPQGARLVRRPDVKLAP